jgi:hypothetical protein
MTLRQLQRVLITIFILTFTLRAQTSTINVEPGKEIKIAEDKLEIKVTKTPSKGTAAVNPPAGSDQMFKLLYRANDASEKTTDELEYQIGGSPAQKVAISIEPKALEFNSKSSQDIFKAVFLLFLLATVIESALALIFNWRPFVETFNARAVRPLVSFLVAYLFVETFHLDLMASIVNSTTTAALEPSPMGKALTALVLAGGSAGVNNLLVALGYRQKQTPETAAPKPPTTQAWIAIRLDRKQAVGQVQVFLGTPLAPNARPPLVGVIHGSSKPGIRYFFSDPGRFPGYGGHAVPANSDVSIELVGVDTNDQALRQTWGPCAVAGGAIIDLDFKL